jgi:hypothetical protein
MKINFKESIAIFLLFLFPVVNFAQTNWVDALDKHGREVFMPADKYKWDWGQATFLNSLIHLYNIKSPSEKLVYLNYVKVAMDATYNVANGKHPNAVASAHGMAFLARVTGDKKYLDKSNEIFADYLKIPRAPNGGVSHRAETNELWDDTVYMLSMYLLEMYRLTNDEKYIEARGLVNAGGGFKIHDVNSFSKTLEILSVQAEKYTKACESSTNFISQNAGATQKTMEFIYENRLLIN